MVVALTASIVGGQERIFILSLLIATCAVLFCLLKTTSMLLTLALASHRTFLPSSVNPNPSYLPDKALPGKSKLIIILIRS